MTRKKNITLFLVITVLLALLFSCYSRPKLYIYNWTSYTPDSVIQKFEEEFGVRVIYDEFTSNEEMYTKLKSGGTGYDIVFPSCYFISIMAKEDMLEKLDHTQLPNLSNIDPAILEIAVYDPNMEYSVPYYYNPAGIIVNTSKVPDFQRSWSIFEREDLRGRMTMLDDMREVIGGALLYLGYSVNSTNPDEIAKAKNHIVNSWKPNLTKFDSDAFGKGYSNGDFWVVHAYAEVVYEEIIDNEQLLKDTVFIIPKEGSPSSIDNMCILKDSKNIELAHKFINFIHRPEIYAEFVDAFNFPSTVNIPARQLKTNWQMYNVEDMINTELIDDPGIALEHYRDAWFNSIRIGK